MIAACLVLAASVAQAAPLALYDTARDTTPLAPLAPTPHCGGFAVACSAEPAVKSTKLPFDYGLSVSGMVGGGSHIGAFSGESVSGWIKPKDIPVTVYFEVERLQPLGRR
jgi:hypothetical protein